MEGVNSIESQKTAGSEKVLVPQNHQTVPKKAAVEPKKVEKGSHAKIKHPEYQCSQQQTGHSSHCCGGGIGLHR